MIEILFQIPNPFLTPTPIPFDPLTAAGGGGIGNGTLIGLAGGALIAAIPIVRSWVEGRNNMAAQTTQTALNSHTAMLTSALARADRLEQQLADLQKAFTELKSEFATVRTQLTDKTLELTSVSKERDDLKHRNAQLEAENDDLRSKMIRMEFLAKSGKSDTEVKQ